MSAKRLTPNKIANLIMADDAWHDSEYVAAADYDAALTRAEKAEAEVERLRAEKDAIKVAAWDKSSALLAERNALHSEVERLLKTLTHCAEYLSCIPESAAGGDDEGRTLARLAREAIAKAGG